MKALVPFLIALMIMTSACSSFERNHWLRIRGSTNTADYYEFIGKNPKSPNLKTAMASIDSLDFAYALSRNMIPDFENYKLKHQSGKYMVQANAAIDSLDWVAASHSNTTDAYSVYLAKHPQGRYSQEAYTIVWDDVKRSGSQDLIASYLNRWAYSPHRNAAYALLWEAAKTENDIVSAREFVQSWPNSPQIQEARTFLDSLLWIWASNIDTYQSYHDYLQDDDKLNYGSEASARKDALDSAGWEASKDSPELYLQRFPGGKHTNAAVMAYLSGESIVGTDVETFKKLLNSEGLIQAELIIKDSGGQSGKGSLNIYKQEYTSYNGYTQIATPTYNGYKMTFPKRSVWASIREVHAVRIASYSYETFKITRAQVYDPAEAERLLLRRTSTYKENGSIGVSEESFRPEGFDLYYEDGGFNVK